MDPAALLKEQFLQMVDEQLERDDLPHTRATWQRLQREGYTASTARLLIAQCVAAEMRRVMARNETFDDTRYIHNLNRLPEPPEAA